MSYNEYITDIFDHIVKNHYIVSNFNTLNTNINISILIQLSRVHGVNRKK